MTLASRIKRMRLLRDMTQEELAEKIGVQKSAIAKYESGRVVNLKRETIRDLAVALSVSPAWLLGLEDAPRPDEFKVTDAEKLLLVDYRNADPVYQRVARELLHTHPRKTEDSHG